MNTDIPIPAPATHTPGDWTAGVTIPNSQGTVYDFRTTITTRTEQVAVIIQAGSRERSEAKANAELFAAAPDLLVACQTLLTEWNAHTPSDETAEAQSITCARVAVTKARGGSTPAAAIQTAQFNHELLSALEKVTAFAAQFSPGGQNEHERGIITELENCCVNLEGILGVARATIAKAAHGVLPTVPAAVLSSTPPSL